MDIPDQRVFGHIHYFEGNLYYTPPNRLTQWHQKFKIGDEFDVRDNDPFSSYIHFFNN